MYGLLQIKNIFIHHTKKNNNSVVLPIFAYYTSLESFSYSYLTIIRKFLILIRNSIPPTTTVQNLKLKVAAAQNQTFVDVGFWGGVVPGNQVKN